MVADKFIISGTGCALADFLYNRISFSGPAFKKYHSVSPGDGGLSPGKLVFTEELEHFAGKPYSEIASEIIGSRTPDAFNVGGPSVVSLIHASQLLSKKEFDVRFYGMAGNDVIAEKIFNILNQTPLNTSQYLTTPHHPSLSLTTPHHPSPSLTTPHLRTPFTDVLSDPDFDHGHGERTFINNIGAAWGYTPDQLTDDFFNSDIVCFGGTALVPLIHDNLSSLLRKARDRGCLTFVNTVYDFRNEKANPGKPWPLVSRPEDFSLIDVLIMDFTEALCISGKNTMEEAADFFISSGVASFFITNGAQELVAWSGGGVFEKSRLEKFPVSQRVTEELKMNAGRKGDTTGCGDNFAGGIIVSLAGQHRIRKRGEFSLVEAVCCGVASGGFCCFSVGGTFLEEHPGQKMKETQRIRQDYLTQIGY
jgi:sugar/nucleoside kinase (ribokinase family)